MIAKLREWLDHRTGYRKLIEALLIEHIPGGAKWRYVWGSTLAFVFSLQLITGVLLMTAYSPGDSTAWSSVYFIQYQMDFGWLIRGLHHFGSGTMVVLLGLHMLQVVIAGAHLPPREINWWLGLALLGLVLAMSLTGYLLPWDQKGYWATQVATNIAGNLPVLGSWVQKIVVGGPSYGHHTLTRFYALHVGVLPPLIIVLILAHLVVFRRHGVTVPHVTIPTDPEGEPLPARGDGWFWPDQTFKDMVVSMIIFAILLGLVVWGHGHKIESAPPPEPDGHGAVQGTSFYERLAHAGRDGLGANLDAPADPSRPYPARPEWYFLFLFQLLKYFEGDQEIIGTLVIPQAAGVLLFLLPLLGYGRMRKFGHVVGFLVVAGMLLGATTLTYLAIAEDRAETEKAKLFQEELKNADALAHRAIQLASDGIPAEGAILLLRRDPLTEGKKLFGQHCAICHTHGDAFNNDKPTASDLAGYGGKDWVLGLLHDAGGDKYFGRVVDPETGEPRLRTMSNWVKRRWKEAKKENTEKDLEAEFDLIAEWLAGHPRAPIPDEKDTSLFARSYRLYHNRCAECHPYKAPADKGPDFVGYGAEDWVRLMIMSPDHPLRYSRKNTMPVFRDVEGATAELTRQEASRIKEFRLREIAGDDPQADKKRKEIDESSRMVHLSDIDRELIIRWLLKDNRAVFGGEPISGPPKR